MQPVVPRPVRPGSDHLPHMQPGYHGYQQHGYHGYQHQYFSPPPIPPQQQQWPHPRLSQFMPPQMNYRGPPPPPGYHGYQPSGHGPPPPQPSDANGRRMCEFFFLLLGADINISVLNQT